ncbi:MAG: histidine phosphatase family protein [Cyanobacteria bacterium J06632_3]
MMKKLHLIRHAKSGWPSSNMADIERPLNQRGVEACAVMAEQIVKAGCSFEHVFCSAAVRTQATLENISQHLEQPILWKVDQALYTFESSDLWTWCRALDEQMAEVVIVGHNNALTDFVNEIGDQSIDNVPTCGYVQIVLPGVPWQAITQHSGTVASFLRPKMFS